MTDHNNHYDKDLISILAHDLRTPISSARNFIDLALHSGEVNANQQMMFERAMKALDRMEVLVDDVLEMSRVDRDAPLNYEPVHIALVIHETASLISGIAQKRQIEIEVNVPAENDIMYAEKARLQQVISNLLVNAVKYNRDGGQVWVTATIEDNICKIVFKDTGYGIPEADIPQIFDKFYRSGLGKEKRIDGSGLGLSIVQTIVEKHGGTIHVDSVLNEGTTFTVTLPANIEFASEK